MRVRAEKAASKPAKTATKKAPRKGTIDFSRLVDEATLAQQNAYAPYSEFRVGAAILTKSGKVFRGCNVENASYPVGICAERTAIVSMVAAGEREPVALAIVTPGKRGGSPCGLCRQTLGEFSRDFPIVLVGLEGNVASVRETSLGELLPDAFEFEEAHDPRPATKAKTGTKKR